MKCKDKREPLCAFTFQKMPDKHHANGVRARNIVSKRHVSMPLKGHMGEDLHIDVEMVYKFLVIYKLSEKIDPYSSLVDV